jgi:hypothetical protein
MSARRRAPAAVVALTAAVLLPACAATTYDASLETTDTVGATTTTTLPSGPASELLPILAEEAAGLSTVMIAEGDARAVVGRVDALWAAVRQEVARDRPELLGDFDANVGRLATAVEFKRAADADKAASNLGVLVDFYLA